MLYVHTTLKHYNVHIIEKPLYDKYEPRMCKSFFLFLSLHLFILYTERKKEREIESWSSGRFFKKSNCDFFHVSICLVNGLNILKVYVRFHGMYPYTDISEQTYNQTFVRLISNPTKSHISFTYKIIPYNCSIAYKRSTWIRCNFGFYLFRTSL